MRRREFIALLGGAAAAWPLAVRAQQVAVPVIGFLSGRSPSDAASALAVFRQGLGEIGYIEGRNVTIEYRWAEGRYDRLPALAADLVGRQVAVIAATGGDPTPLAAKAATTTIPIVFTIGGDPVQLGLVTSFNKPGGNVTGVTFMNLEFGAKRLELLHQLVPNAASIAMLVDPNYPLPSAEMRDVQTAALSLGLQINVLNASTENQMDAAFTNMVQQRAGALLVGANILVLVQRDRLVRLAARHGVPTIYFAREFVDAGGLMSYGANIISGYQHAGVYVGRILKGEKPVDLPVMRPTKFDLIINLNTAKALGLTVPDKLLALADEVIE
jgi:putative tryptophan/tyrosine transport system substrate-binding protein